MVMSRLIDHRQDADDGQPEGVSHGIVLPVHIGIILLSIVLPVIELEDL